MNFDPIHTIQGEIYGLLSHLKLNTRWSSNQYHPIIPANTILIGLKNLSNQLHKETDFKTLDTVSYLDPFLLVIRSQETSGPITGTALTSVNKFLNLFINADSNNIQSAIKSIAESAAHCKFEATDSRSDEVVLMKILQVLLSCVKNPAGIYLSDDLVYEIVQTCYLMIDQSRSSELLKKTAEVTIQEIVTIIFQRYNSIPRPPPTPPPCPPPSIMISTPIIREGDETTTTSAAVTMVDPITSLILEDQQQFSPNADLFFSNLPQKKDDDNNNNNHKNTSHSQPSSPIPSHSQNVPSNSSSSNSSNSSSVNQSRIINDYDKCYDESVLIRIFKFFSSNVRPSTHDSEMTRLLCLNLINIIIQNRGELLEDIPDIMDIVKDDLFKSLLLNLQSKSIPIFSLTMRIFFNLFVSLRKTLKAQFEEFFNVLLRTIIDKSSQEYVRNMTELYELALEGLRDFCKLPLAMADLFINYDCELYCTNIFETLCKILYKNSFPLGSGNLTSLHILSLENLLAIIQSIDDRTRYPKYIPHSQVATINSLTLQYNQKREFKRLMGIAADHFNARSPKDAFDYLIDNKIYQEMNPSSISKFLIETPKLNKHKVGEYLAKRNPLNSQVLAIYVGHFVKVHSDNYILAYRNFLESFWIPGEAGVVDRIFEPLSEQIFSTLTAKGELPASFTNPDKIFVYLYSGLMLHTSSFNPKVTAKDRFTYQSFKQLLVPSDISEDLIKAMYEEMTANELCVDEEPANPGVVSYSTWKNIMKKSKKVEYFETVTSNEYDKDIFPIILNVAIPAISNVFEKIDNDALSQRILDGFHLCAQVSANYNINESIDTLMNSLCSNTTLIDKEGTAVDPQQPSFYDDNKAQLVTITTFEIAIKYAGHLRESWKSVIGVVCKLNKLGLLPNIFEEIDFPIESKKQDKTQTDKQQTSTQKQNSLLKWFVSESEFVGDNETNKYEQKAKTCVDNCNIKDLFLETRTIPLQSLEHLLQDLYLLTTPKNNIFTFNQKQALFCFDLITHIILFNRERLHLIWGQFYKHIENIIITWDQSPKLSAFIEKTVLSTMYLLIRLLDAKEVSATLEPLVSLIVKVKTVVDSVAEKMSIGLVQLVQQNLSYLTSDQTIWEPINAIIVLLSGNPKSSARACEALATTIGAVGLTPKTCKDCLETIQCFFTSDTIPHTVTSKAMELMFVVFEAVNGVLQIDIPMAVAAASSSASAASVTDRIKFRSIDRRVTDAWEQYWSCILESLRKLCLHKTPNIRNNAMTYLQKCMLSPNLSVLSAQKWMTCFVDVVFPLLTDLKVNANVPNYEDMRVRAAALLSKVFLQHLTTINTLDTFLALWTEILVFYRQYMGLSELLSESVPESLKNMLLVMNNSRVFKDPSDADSNDKSRALWELTWKNINEFCPKIKDDVLPRVSPQPLPQQQQVENNNIQSPPSSTTTTITQQSDPTVAPVPSSLNV
ncbi:Arf guanyl-nucleotide exchange factor [Cavenderia fasciculata]|uniref:Arf guanyl-nucleotide exchange factor n=1 Tax=Cavenderia fasciculata TaxID=261658 RepID=F4PM68_CACFS|nr:Arf guanyl-nucleotide exchange factor [Cavenderia fasciculata]EGG23568.1 Arf guanyl-nucleotide exchange factor [Cavenderia fasciculata]|eukprot:XP_004361419.1 Arf guanyl-nucleotide exchange factor [Cavenderia fasciculata]